ncbi:hypothetical protein OAT16_04445 [Prolixibacteraceae bacterium]|nr:hypothetical protein [Prolixibacteraceae bacterium]
MKKITLLITLLIILAMQGNAQQNNAPSLERILRINLLNPSVELEMPICDKTVVSINTGVSLNGTYDNVSWGYGVTYFIAPNLDVKYKYLYNRTKRARKGKNLKGNSGNYWGFKCQTSFKELYSHNVSRETNTQFVVGPVWGMQRASNKIHFLWDIGPSLCIDTEGNMGFFPISFKINLGFNLSKK